MSTNQRGDTLIEVLLAMALLAIVTLALHSVMNRGLADMQLALERTSVRTAMTGQSNILRALRDDYMAQKTAPAPGTPGVLWAKILQSVGDGGYLNTNSAQKPTFNETTCNATNKAFYLTHDGSGIKLQDYTNQPAVSYAQPGAGLWVEAYPRGDVSPQAVDVMIRGCWSALGDKGLVHETTTMRLYDGR